MRDSVGCSTDILEYGKEQMTKPTREQAAFIRSLTIPELTEILVESGLPHSQARAEAQATFVRSHTIQELADILVAEGGVSSSDALAKATEMKAVHEPKRFLLHSLLLLPLLPFFLVFHGLRKLFRL